MQSLHVGCIGGLKLQSIEEDITHIFPNVVSIDLPATTQPPSI